MKFYLSNKSKSISSSDYQNILKGLEIFFSNLSLDWDLSRIEVSESTQPLSSNYPNTIIIFDEVEDETNLSYNFDTDSNAVARIFAKNIIDFGGCILYEEECTLTVSQQICSEILGLISNSNMNKWYMDSNKCLWWGDICSPVYGNILPIEIETDLIVGLSDYVLPRYFGPNGGPSPFNKSDTLLGPFSLDEKGYSIKFENNNFVASFGENCPQEKIDQVNDYLEEFKLRFNNQP